MRHGIWATLDCDPTTDRGTIRRAYAARLKAMDVDADPDAFEALRNARDAALAQAAAMVAEGMDAPPAAPVEIAPSAPVEAAPPATPEADFGRPVDLDRPADIPPPAAPMPEVDPLARAMDAHFHALESLLFPGHDRPPTAEELTEIAHHGRALLADPRLEQLDFATDAERWFAETLAACVPRSDPLLEPAAAVFGWIERRNDYALSAEAHAIVERIGAMRFAALVGDPKHRLHKAWQELNRGGDRPAPLWNPRKPQRELLSLIRTRFPMVETWLEPQRVADVDDPASPAIGLPVWLILLAVVTILRIAMTGPAEQPPTRPPAFLPAPTVSPPIAPAIPVTAPRPDADTYIRGLTHAPDALLREIAEWELKVMRYYQPFDTAQCVDSGLWRVDAKLATAWEEKRYALVDTVAIHARGPTLPVPSRRFELQGDIVKAVMKITGFDRARFQRSLTPDAPLADQCATQIGIRQAALDTRSAAGRKLLRDLQLTVFGE